MSMKNLWAFIEAYFNAYHVIDKLYGSHKIMICNGIWFLSNECVFYPRALAILDGIENTQRVG